MDTLVLTSLHSLQNQIRQLEEDVSVTECQINQWKNTTPSASGDTRDLLQKDLDELIRVVFPSVGTLITRIISMLQSVESESYIPIQKLTNNNINPAEVIDINESEDEKPNPEDLWREIEINPDNETVQEEQETDPLGIPSDIFEPTVEIVDVFSTSSKKKIDLRWNRKRSLIKLKLSAKLIQNPKLKINLEKLKTDLRKFNLRKRKGIRENYSRNVTAANFTVGNSHNFGYQCFHCRETFSNPDRRSEHIKKTQKYPDNICEENVGYHCPFCTETMVVVKSQSTLENHIRIKHPGQCIPKIILNNIQPFKCRICRISFSTLPPRDEHEAEMHFNMIYNCDQCDKKYNNKRELNQHKQRAHKRFPCKIESCEEIFGSVDLRDIHTIHLHPDYVLQKPTIISQRSKQKQCEICKRILCDNRAYQNHLKLHEKQKPNIEEERQNENQNWHCPICDENFNFYDELNSHKCDPFRGENSIALEFKCDQCTKSYEYYKSLQTHKRRSHRSPDEPWPCYRCPQDNRLEFKTMDELRKHQKYDHVRLIPKKVSSDKGAFKCTWCRGQSQFRKYKTAHELREHRKRVHPHGKPVPKIPPPKSDTLCSHCGKLFSEDSLRRHIELVHMRVKCPQCKRKFLPDKLAEHVETMHKDGAFRKNRKFTAENSVHKCEICNNYYGNMKSLIRHHERMHLKTRELFNCPHCSSGFHREKTLHNHVYTCHLNPVPKEVIQDKKRSINRCLQCKKGFLTRHMLEGHIRQVHTLERVTCPRCFRRILKDNLDSHLKVHERREAGELKPTKYTAENSSWKCELCDTYYARSFSLSRHNKRVHQKVRNYACDFCPMSFFTSDKFKQHLRTHLVIKSAENNEREKPQAPKTSKSNPQNTSGQKRPQTQSNSKRRTTRKSRGKHFARNTVHTELLAELETELTETQPSTNESDNDESEKGIKYFGCNICPTAFYTANELEEHLRKHRRGEGVSSTSNQQHQKQGPPQPQLNLNPHRTRGRNLISNQQQIQMNQQEQPQVNLNTHHTRSRHFVNAEGHQLFFELMQL